MLLKKAKQRPGRRAYFYADEKKDILAEIAEIQTELLSVKSVPARVLNGSVETAIAFKTALEQINTSPLLRKPLSAACSGRELKKALSKLKEVAAAVL